MKSLFSVALVSGLLFFETVLAVSDIQMLEGPNGEKRLLFGDMHFPLPSKEAEKADHNHMTHFFEILELQSKRDGLNHSQCVYESLPLVAEIDENEIHVTFRDLRKKEQWHLQSCEKITCLEPADIRNFYSAMVFQDFFELYNKLENLARSQGGTIDDIRDDSKGLDAKGVVKDRLVDRNIYAKASINILDHKWFLESLSKPLDKLHEDISAYKGTKYTETYLKTWSETFLRRFSTIRKDFEAMIDQNPTYDTIDILFALTKRDGHAKTSARFNQELTWAAADIYFLYLALKDINSPQILILGSAHAKFVGDFLTKHLGFQGKALNLVVTSEGIKSTASEQKAFFVAMTEALEWIHTNPESKPIQMNANYCKTCGKEKSKEKSLLRCGRCKTTYYCSKECQGADWGKHKVVCKTQL